MQRWKKGKPCYLVLAIYLIMFSSPQNLTGGLVALLEPSFFNTGRFVRFNARQTRLAPTRAIRTGKLNKETGEYDYNIPIVPVHKDLKDIVFKHMDSLSRYEEHKQITNHTQEAYKKASDFVRRFHLDKHASWEPGSKLPVILDSGCGTGRSAVSLANAHPDLPVLGVDRSLARLGRSAAFRYSGGAASEELEEEPPPGGGGGDGAAPEMERGQPKQKNLLLLRAELSDFWRLIDESQEWKIEKHSLFYPNPYVKPKQLKSRFHGHPVFPIFLKIGGEITVRSNWKTYVDEFAKAVEHVDEYLSCRRHQNGGNFAKKYLKSAMKGAEEYLPPVGTHAMTNFEKKYIEAGEVLYQIVLSEK